MGSLILRPNGDVSIQMARSTGSYNYACVDEETKDEADYVISQGVVKGSGDKIDIYSIPNHSLESGTINSVTVKMYAYCSTAAKISYFLVYIGSVQYSSDAVMLSSPSYSLNSNTWDINPNTGSAWTWEDIDALAIGVSLPWEITDKFDILSKCCQLWVEVDYTEGASGHPTAKRFGGVPFCRLNNGIWCF